MGSVFGVPDPSARPPVPGGFVHDGHPFDAPGEQRDPVRRLRGRLAAAVTLWTAGEGRQRAGLTVSPVVMSAPDALAGSIGADTDLADTVVGTGRFVVHVLDWAQRQAADRFALTTPSPGGLFASDGWTQTAWGPVLDGVGTWAGCRVEATHPFGHGVLLVASVEHAEVAELPRPLLWQRGRYRSLA